MFPSFVFFFFFFFFFFFKERQNPTMTHPNATDFGVFVLLFLFLFLFVEFPKCSTVTCRERGVGAFLSRVRHPPGGCHHRQKIMHQPPVGLPIGRSTEAKKKRFQTSCC
eukprot:TRINITY_DN15882_c0_g2_i2.p1 TRINITY_DN15882_c0_g2~~TRINITY_DN15882_c0_g2_i2.p1  ORF type:complete len:109 (-),score=9.30 TRINITY_DN15882_c0_g2_i2:20-346(-)